MTTQNDKILLVQVTSGAILKYSQSELEDMLINWKMYKSADNLPKWLMTNNVSNTQKSIKLEIAHIIEYALVEDPYFINASTHKC